MCVRGPLSTGHDEDDDGERFEDGQEEVNEEVEVEKNGDYETLYVWWWWWYGRR